MLIVTLGTAQKTQITDAEKLADVIELRSDLYDCTGIRSEKPLLVTGPDCPVKARYRDGGKGEVTIASYHNFEETPEDLFACLQGEGDIYKVATMAHSTLDALRMLLFVREATARGIPVVGHCMGEPGQLSRILGPIYGNRLTYACLDAPVAPGQLPAKTLLETYNFRSLNSETKVYGLIGDPIEESRGHLYHNAFFRDNGINAVYVKMRVQPHEVKPFLAYAKELGFAGLSVTMPLKELVLPPDAINTLRLDEEWEGCNTDGEATAQAIERRMALDGKRVLLYGAGGFARAVAHALKARGALITITNRTRERQEKLAAEVGAATDARAPCAIFINATSLGMNGDSVPLPEKVSLVVDAVQRKTPLLSAAEERGVPVISGAEIFELQAKLQQDFWALNESLAFR